MFVFQRYLSIDFNLILFFFRPNQELKMNSSTNLQNPTLVVNSMLTALAQSLLPSSTNQQVENKTK